MWTTYLWKGWHKYYLRFHIFSPNIFCKTLLNLLCTLFFFVNLFINNRGNRAGCNWKGDNAETVAEQKMKFLGWKRNKCNTFWQSWLDKLYMRAFVFWKRCATLMFSKITFQKTEAVTIVVLKKILLQVLQNSLENNCIRVSFSMKLQADGL